MCFLCLQENPFEAAEAFAKPYDGRNASRAKAVVFKELIKSVEAGIEKEDLCDIGDATLERMKEKQYELAREL
jgi:hypothetical protein